VRHIHTDLHEHLDVREESFVRGRVRSGATVHADGLLLVDGTVEGTVRIGTGGTLVLNGLLAAFIDGNCGSIAVSGGVSTPLEMVPGQLLFAEGSFATIDGEFRIVTRSGFQTALATTVTDGDLRERVVLQLVRPSMQVQETTHDAFTRLEAEIRRSRGSCG
jgi:hypothetical protein